MNLLCCQEQNRSSWWTKWCRGWSVEVFSSAEHFFLGGGLYFLCGQQCLLHSFFLQGMYTGVFTEEEFRSLGIMATFVVDEIFVQVDRSFFTDNLDFLWGLCYSSSKMDIVTRVLQEPATFG